MKKIIFFIIITALLITATSCNVSKQGNVGGKMTIKFVGSPNMAVEKDSATEKYLEEKFDVNLDVISITTGYYDKLATMFAANNIPDVMFMNDASNWNPLADQNIIAPIDLKVVEKNAPKHFAYINNYEKKLWKIGEYKNVFYAIPKTMGNEYNTVMVWRQDWLNAVEIDKVPDTIEECEKAFIKFRNNDPDKNGVKDTYGLTGLGGSAWRQFDAIFGAFGIMPGQWKLVNGELINCTISNEAKHVLELLHRWYEMELIDPELITDTVESVGQKFELGRIGVMNSGLLNISDNHPHGNMMNKKFKQSHPDSKLIKTYGPLPAGPKGDRGDWLWGPLSNFVVFGVQLEKDIDKQAKILQILDDINYNSETAVKVTYGEKGNTFDYNTEEVGAKSGIKYLPPYDTDANERAKVGIGIGGFFNLFSSGDWADSSIVEMYTNDKFIEENKKNANWGNCKDALMRVSLPSNARFKANLEKIKTTSYSSFITGQKSLDQWDDFVKEYLDNGGSVLLEEAQAYYRENLK